MVKQSFEVDIEPEIISWVLDSSGWSKDEIISKLGISRETFDGWLNKTKKPTLIQLEKLSKLLKRPLAVFFLPKAPKKEPLPQDYRMIPGRYGKFDKKTLLAIRKARRLQNVSKALSENVGFETVPDITYVNVSDDPKKIAEDYREKFQITENVQKELKTSREVFNNLRSIIENKRILVFQMAMPLEDARGFALVDTTPLVIVINSKDLVIEARIFTLMHEFGHALLKKSGVSIPENSMCSKETDLVEKWCNDFASEFLLPENVIRDIFSKNKANLLEKSTLETLSKTYKVSKSMLIYNMSKYDFIPKEEYHAIFERFKSRKLESKGKKQKGGIPSDRKCISEKGRKFISLIIQNVENKAITCGDALDYLSIKLKGFEKLNAKFKK